MEMFNSMVGSAANANDNGGIGWNYPRVSGFFSIPVLELNYEVAW